MTTSKVMTLSDLNKKCREAYRDLIHADGTPFEGRAVQRWKKLYNYIAENAKPISQALSGDENIYALLKKHSDSLDIMVERKIKVAISRKGLGSVRILDDKGRTEFLTLPLYHPTFLRSYGIKRKNPGYYIMLCILSWEQDTYDKSFAISDHHTFKTGKDLFPTENAVDPDEAF